MINSEELENSLGRRIFNEFLSEHFEHSMPTLSQKFDKLTEMYFNFNSVVNISALRTLDDVYIKHYLDSVFPYKHFVGACCDVGCGGGFPCIPLALVTPHEFLGIDGVAKKLTLIMNASFELCMKNISALHVRAEELAKTRKFDTVSARAVADIDTALSYCAPLADKNGKIILYRTQNDERATTKTENKYKIELSDIIDYTLPSTEIKRRLFIYRKTA